MIRAAANSESNSFRYLFVVWFAVTSCLIVGFVTVGATSASGDPFEIVDVVAQTGPDPEGPEAFQPSVNSIADQHPSVTYGGLAWSILESRLIHKSETTTGKPIVVVEAVVANTTRDRTVRVRDSDVAIAWPDGRKDEVSRFEQLRGVSSFALEAGQSQDLTLVFKPQINFDPDITELVLEIAEPGRISAVLPLIGEPEPSPYPIPGVLGSGVSIVADPDHPENELIIAPLTADLDIDAGPYRAALGHQLAVVAVSVQRTTVSPNAAFLKPDFWQLWINGEPLHPDRVIITGTPSANEDELTLLFVIGDEVTDMILTVAADTAQSAEYPITFPAQ